MSLHYPLCAWNGKRLHETYRKVADGTPAVIAVLSWHITKMIEKEWKRSHSPQRTGEEMTACERCQILFGRQTVGGWFSWGEEPQILQKEMPVRGEPAGAAEAQKGSGIQGPRHPGVRSGTGNRLTVRMYEELLTSESPPETPLQPLQKIRCLFCGALETQQL